MSNYTYQPTSTNDYQQVPTNDAGKAMSITSLVLSGVAFLVIPLLFGLIAAIFAGIGMSKGEGTIAKWAMAAAVVNMGYGAIALLSVLSEIGAL